MIEKYASPEFLVVQVLLSAVPPVLLSTSMYKPLQVLWFAVHYIYIYNTFIFIDLFYIYIIFTFGKPADLLDTLWHKILLAKKFSFSHL